MSNPCPRCQRKQREIKRLHKIVRDFRTPGDAYGYKLKMQREYHRGYADGKKATQERIQALEDTIKLAGLPLPEPQRKRRRD